MKITIDNKSTLSAYSQISKFLEQYIVTKKLSAGSPLPSVRNIAEWSDTSVRTVHRAIELLNRQGICYQLPQKGIFFTGRAKGAKRKRLPFIGVYNSDKLYGSPCDSINMALLSGIQKTCSESNREILIFQDISKSIISHYVHDLLSLDSLIIMQTRNFEEINKLARVYPMINFISLNYFYSEFRDSPSNVCGVFNDDYWGAYKMTEYLLSQGHKSIIFITKNIADYNYKYRVQGFLGAISNNNLDSDRFPVLNIENNIASNKYKLQEELLATVPNATVLFCASDNLAMHASQLNKGDKHKNIILVSYDHFIKTENKQDRQQPVVEIEFEEMGKKAAEIAITGERKKEQRLKPKLITSLNVANNALRDA